MAKKPRNCKTAQDSSIIGGAIYFEDCLQCALQDESAVEILDDRHLKAIRLVSLSQDWNLRVWHPDATIVEKINFEMTLRKEKRGQKMVWYAYRRVFGTLHKRYVGDSSQLNERRLLDIAQKLPGRP